MSFIQAVIKHPTRALKEVPKATGTVTVKGELLAWAVGLAVAGTNSTVRSAVIGICNQSIAAAEALLIVPVIEIFEGDVFVVDSTNNTNVAHNGQRMVLTSSTVVNNTGSDSASGIVQQVDVYGATGDRKLLVTFV